MARIVLSIIMFGTGACLTLDEGEEGPDTAYGIGTSPLHQPMFDHGRRYRSAVPEPDAGVSAAPSAGDTAEEAAATAAEIAAEEVGDGDGEVVDPDRPSAQVADSDTLGAQAITGRAEDAPPPSAR